MSEWKPFETAPKDGTEILAWRRDAGVLMIRHTSMDAFLTESELEDYDEATIFQEDWFYADFVQGGRLDEDLPTHWMHLPDDPEDIEQAIGEKNV